MAATADILVEQKNDVLLVPNRALRFLPPEQAEHAEKPSSGSRVWILRDGAAAAVAVSIGLTNGDFTEIEPGALDAGAQVIVDVVRTERPRPTGGGPFG